MDKISLQLMFEYNIYEGSGNLFNYNGSIVNVTDDSLTRDSFETYEEFRERIENLKSVNIGKAEILIDSYDEQCGICFINVEFYKWNSINGINYDYLYFIFQNKKIEFVKSLNDRYTIRASLTVKGEKVYVNTKSITICIEDMELEVYPISFVKMPFETENDFKDRIINIKDMPLGKISIDRDNYDINTCTFKIKVDIDTFNEVKVPDLSLFYIVIDREEVEKFYKDNSSCTLYGGLNYIDGQIFVDIQGIYLLWMESKISVHTVIFSNVFFDTTEEYTNQIKSLSLLSAGETILDIDKYNPNEEILPVIIEWESWISEYVSDIKNTYIESDRRLSKELYEAGDRYRVYVVFRYDNNCIEIDKIKLINFKGEIEIKFNSLEKDIDNTAIEERYPVVDVIAYDSSNEDDYVINEKFDFINGIALMKINGSYTYVDSKGRKLGLINNRLMRFIDSKGKYGYMDKEDRITIIKPYFDYIGAFNDNIARININDKWGYINEEGQIIISPIYELARDFHDGLAAVKIKSLMRTKWGYINRLGEIVIRARFDEVGEFSNGIAHVKVKSILKGIKEGFIYKDGEFHDCVKI